MSPPVTWVVGAGGLLGSSLARSLQRRGGAWAAPTGVPWGTARAIDTLVEISDAFAATAAGRSWSLAWCAGAGVTGATAADLAGEVTALGVVLDRLAAAMTPGGLRRGTVLLCSSVGGAYGGATGAPFTESSPTRPLSAYGEAKLRQESIATAWARRHGVRLVVTRLTNVYGPNQDLRKPQGLLSQVARAHLLRQPIRIVVPLDTVRDYLYADDAGDLAADCLDRASATAPGQTHIKILGSHQGTTIGAVLAEMGRLVKRRPAVVYGEHATSRMQARDLRVRSTVWPDLDRRPLTPLPVGLAAVVARLSAVHRAGRLSAPAGPR